MCWEIRLIYQLQLHFLYRQVESLTHKVEHCRPAVLRCSLQYCGFITSCGGFNPCNNHHNSQSLWWISSNTHLTLKKKKENISDQISFKQIIWTEQSTVQNVSTLHSRVYFLSDDLLLLVFFLFYSTLSLFVYLIKFPMNNSGSYGMEHLVE